MSKRIIKIKLPNPTPPNAKMRNALELCVGYPEIKPEELKSVKAYFDAQYYRSVNRDVVGTDIELLQHYLVRGWRESRDPNAEFSTEYYLNAYPDIGRNNLNPFLHFILFGRQEGRRGRGDEPARLHLDKSSVPVNAGLRGVANALSMTKKLIPLSARPKTGAPTLHWIIPDFTGGGGGHMTIFRMIRHLENFGHKCKIWINQRVFHETVESIHSDIVKHYQCIQSPVGFIDEKFLLASDDIVIATSWQTAYTAQFYACENKKIYFVQDFEPAFYAAGGEQHLAEQTYKFEFGCICASPWLENMMRNKYKRWARSFYLAINKNEYFIIDKQKNRKRFLKRNSKKFKIAVYARVSTARRCVDLTLLALYLLAVMREDIEVHFFGQANMPFNSANYVAYNHGVLSTTELCNLYNDCHLGICLSATNYSLVPQEMMACGLPVLELDTESTQSVFPKGVVTLGGPSPEDLRDKLNVLIDDPARRKAQARAALEWVSMYSWESAARQVEAGLREYVGSRSEFRVLNFKKNREIILDVVIPTFNDIAATKNLIRALRNQSERDSIQIYCIDSNSSDGTPEWLRKQKDVALTSIDQRDFQHGRTRNLGAGLGRAQYIAMLTQDAPPANEVWAMDILKMFQHYPEAAGLFGRHIPYVHHSLFVQEEVNTHFNRLLEVPLALSKNTNASLWNARDRNWMQLLHFYSDNNSAMAREVWKEIPYPEIEYGEDQVWAKRIIEAGHTKLYAPTASVFHSHDYDPGETFERSRTESKFFFNEFGYCLCERSKGDVDDAIQRDQGFWRQWAASRQIDSESLTRWLAKIEAKYRGWHEGLGDGVEKA